MRNVVISMGSRIHRQWDIAWSTMKMLFAINRAALITSIVAGIVNALLYPALLVLIGAIFSLLLASGGKIENFMQKGLIPVVGLFGIIFVQLLLSSVNETATTLLRNESSKEINTRIIEKLAQTPYPLFEENSFQARYGLAIAEASYRPGMLVDSLLGTGTALIAFLGIVITLLTIAPIIVLLLVIVILFIAVETLFHQRMLDMQTASAPELFRMQYLTQRSIDATWQRDVRVYASPILHEEFATLSRAYLAKLKRLLKRFQSIRLLIGIAASAAIALSAILIFWLISSNILAPSYAGIVFSALCFGLLQGRALSSSAGSLTECLSYIEKIFTFLDEDFGQPPEMQSREREKEVVSIPACKSIILEELTFKYPHAAKAALSRLSYEFPVGMTALVGPNGAGKSTLVKLLTGLLTPTSGRIQAVLQNGTQTDIQKLPKAVLFQEPAHLHLTVRQNITMRTEREENEEDRVYTALEQAGLAEVVRNLEEGLDTLVGAGFGGKTDLSGGQWQRLALARLIYHESPIILLDEPIASLDPEGERQIFQLFSQLACTKIIIFTTHRYDSIPADANVVVVVDGKIIESGIHAELQQEQSAYWALTNLRRETRK